MAIKIPFLSDMGDFIRGLRNGSTSVDELAGTLDDLGADAGRTSTVVGRELQDVADDARDSARTVERKFSEAFDTVKAESRQSFRSVGDVAKDESHRAGEATSEFKDEARQNFGEIASSFSGDMASAGDLVQGTLGGLAGSMAGPVGLALGGLSILGGAFAAKWQESAAKVEQRISDMYDDMLQSGADFLSKDYISGELQKIYKGADDAAIKVGELRDLAASAEISEPLLARALVGDEAARAQITSEIAAKRLAINEALDDATARGENLAPALSPAIQALQDVEDKVQGTAAGFTQAQANADAARAAIAGVSDATRGVAASAEDARGKFDGIGRSLAGLPSSVRVSVEPDFTVFDRLLRNKTGSVGVYVTPRAGISVP